MKRHNHSGGERNQELVVNKRTNLLWLESRYQTTIGKIPATAHFCLFLLLSQMFDMMALSDEGVCE